MFQYALAESWKTADARSRFHWLGIPICPGWRHEQAEAELGWEMLEKHCLRRLSGSADPYNLCTNLKCRYKLNQETTQGSLQGVQ